MKKLAAVIFILLLLGGLAACQLSSTPTPAPAPSVTPAATNTPLPPTATLVPTATPTPKLNAPNGPPLRLIKMFDGKNGWGSISNALLVTHDGGITWFSVPIPDGQVDESSEPFFIDMNTLYIVLPAPDKSGGLLHFTTNGGGTWESLPVPFVHGQLAVKANVLYFLEIIDIGPDSAAMTIYLSGDTGKTWNKVFSLEKASIPESGMQAGISLLNEEHAWLTVAGVDQKIEIFRSAGFGNTWKPQQIPEPQNISDMLASALPPMFFQGSETEGILPVNFTSKASGEQNLVFYSTIDGGQTWLPGGSVLAGGAYTFLDPKTGWAWGKRGVYFTNDGGQTWQGLPVAFGRSEHATCLSFVNASTGWMLTTDARNRVRIYSTSDGGNTWMSVNP